MPSDKQAKSTAAKAPRKSRKSTAKKSEPVVIPDVSDVLEESQAQAQVAPPVESKPEIEVEAVDESIVRPTTSRRGSSTREELEVAFESLLERISSQIEAKKADKTHSMTLKTLRSLSSDIKRLRTDSLRLTRKGKRNTNRASTNSGFQKPVSVSKGMSKFAGWDPKELHSRVDVTKVICNYVKEHNLQNPSDRRQIIPDSKLSKLLAYDSKTEEEPLTYYYLQRKIQPHFV